MENIENNDLEKMDKSSANERDGGSKMWMVGATVIIALGALWYFSLGSLNDDVNMVPGDSEEASAISDIESDINDIDLGDLDAEFKAIDEDLNSL
jgi:hypothetical protein